MHNPAATYNVSAGGMVRADLKPALMAAVAAKFDKQPQRNEKFLIVDSLNYRVLHNAFVCRRHGAG